MSTIEPAAAPRPPKTLRAPRRHGHARHYIEGEGWVTEALCKRGTGVAYPLADPAPPDEGAPEPALQFCRLLPRGRRPDEDALIALGQAMETETHGVGPTGDSDVPAGYTYLGQFIDHDITFAEGDLDLGDGPVRPDDVPNRASPSLDLDSLYGRDAATRARVLEDDGLHFRIGLTSPTVGREPGAPIAGGFRNDLPREGTRAVIADPRNDENLAVAQTHLAFLKFHNRAVDRMRSEDPGRPDAEVFEAARREVTLRYQSIVLDDFLPRIIETDVLQEVLARGPRLYTDTKGDCMPVEFAVAAFRLGHSMVRPSYDWNRVFHSGAIPATFNLLFEFSGLSGTRGAGDPPFGGKPTLPSNWIVDWTRMYDFGGRIGSLSNDVQMTRKLDTVLALDLKELPEFERMGGVDPALLSLATRNLLRGRQLQLPTGEEAAEALKAAGLHFKKVPPEIIANGPQRRVLEEHGLVGKTPLWFYILREAKVRHDGDRLGPVGSWLLAEFFVGAIRRSRVSVLKEPSAPTFSMPELLRAVGDLNPLGVTA